MYMIIALSIAIHTSYIGSRIVVSLYALQMGASQFTIGVLAALYSTVPLILGVYSGKLVDSTGTRWPLIGGAIVILIGQHLHHVVAGSTAPCGIGIRGSSVIGAHPLACCQAT